MRARGRKGGKYSSCVSATERKRTEKWNLREEEEKEREREEGAHHEQLHTFCRH